MKKLCTILMLLIMTLFMINARCEDDSDKKRRERMLLAAWLITQPVYTPANCITYMQPLNPFYGLPDYYLRWKSDPTQYDVIIRGNSTMDISCRYDGFLSATTQCVAIGGNTLCDMTTQRASINTIDPSAVIISSGGGNDVIRLVSGEYGITETNVYDNGVELVNQTRAEFQNAKIVWLTIHPTKNAALNAATTSINANLSAYVNSLSNTCVVDMYALFGKSPGEAADNSQMLDDIHYTQAMSFIVKDAVYNQCGVSI